MRKVPVGQILAALKNASEEDKQAWQHQDEKWPPKSFDEMTENAAERSSLAARLGGCQCIDAAKQCQQELVEQLRKQFDNVIPEEETSLNRAINHRLIGKVARKYARKRMCHFTMKYLVCYCDEHNH